MKTLLVRTLEQWRDRLTEHHASESEVWLIFHVLVLDGNRPLEVR